MMNFAENKRTPPTVWMNEFSCRRSRVVPVSTSRCPLNLTLVVAPLSLWKWHA